MANIWQTALAAHYGLKADLTSLDGEYDLNLALTAPDYNGILKVMRPGADADFIAMQIAALSHIHTHWPNAPLPQVRPTLNGASQLSLPDDTGAARILWVQSRLPGGAYAKFNPKSLPLITALGQAAARLNRALQTFEHPQLDRPLKWALPQALWIADQLDCIADPERRAQLTNIISSFRAIQPQLAALPQQAIHNDLNDHNILVTPSLLTAPDISGLIDLGDMCRAPRICDLAIAGAYIVLDHPNPAQALAALTAAYHAETPLSDDELTLLVPLLNMRLAVSVVNSTLESATNPDDPYVTISQAPAWRYLANRPDDTLLTMRLHHACGRPISAGAARIGLWLNDQRGQFAPLMGAPVDNLPMGALSVAASTTPQNPLNLGPEEAAQIGAEFGTDWLGYYAEPRLIYTAKPFQKGRFKHANRRTVHIAVDVFAPAQRALLAPLAGTVAVVENRAQHLDYGGVVILRHETPQGDEFFTLYGHLNPECCARLAIGDTVAKGEEFVKLGDPSQNGGWAPHVHFQLALTTAGMGDDWPGVADPDEADFWCAICPNPASLLNLPDAQVQAPQLDKSALQSARAALFGGNVKLSYRRPVALLRGWKHHMFDEMGRPYLDAYNNVPHVGHAHPRIVAAAANQIARVNTNTRYLHPLQVAYADRLTSLMPKGLDTCFLVNSGSEANELALRLARAATGGKDIITPRDGYHGNTNTAIDISAYKFAKPGGVGQRDWVHLVDVPCTYRGAHRGAEAGANYAAQIGPALGAIAARGGKLAGFIAETFPSVGGQIIPPTGYLPDVYARIRTAGGICIADEVQTGLGRLGRYMFGFEHQGVVPDIVVLGKPIGNGHPLGAVITTRAIADAFNNGIEYFSTFGGSTLSCRIGLEVLDILADETLAENAAARGDELAAGLADLATRHPLIGDIRGMGLFWGVDLVTDQTSRTPATAQAAYLVNRMAENRVLIGVEGPADNVLKIRPPLTIDAEGIAAILAELDSVLAENALI